MELRDQKAPRQHEESGTVKTSLQKIHGVGVMMLFFMIRTHCDSFELLTRPIVVFYFAEEQLSPRPEVFTLG